MNLNKYLYNILWEIKTQIIRILVNREIENLTLLN